MAKVIGSWEKWFTKNQYSQKPRAVYLWRDTSQSLSELISHAFLRFNKKMFSLQTTNLISYFWKWPIIKHWQNRLLTNSFHLKVNSKLFGFLPETDGCRDRWLWNFVKRYQDSQRQEFIKICWMVKSLLFESIGSSSLNTM